MKKMRRLIPAIAMLLVSAVMLSTASFAWFTISSEAKAEGMTVSAMAASSLLIVNPQATGTADASFLTSNGVATFTNSGTNLQPATHETNQNVNSSTGLVYINNTKDVIDPATGLPKTELPKDAEGNTINPGWAAAEEGYYIDYTVYLGTSATAMENAPLKAIVTADASKVAQIHNAIAIDFLVGSNYTTTAGTTTAATYVPDATAHLADAKAGNGVTVNLGNITIPVAVSTAEDATEATATGDYVIVTMRVYFDGAYTGTGTTAYIRDAYSTSAECPFNVTFDAD